MLPVWHWLGLQRCRWFVAFLASSKVAGVEHEIQDPRANWLQISSFSWGLGQVQSLLLSRRHSKHGSLHETRALGQQDVRVLPEGPEELMPCPEIYSLHLAFQRLEICVPIAGSHDVGRQPFVLYRYGRYQILHRKGSQGPN